MDWQIRLVDEFAQWLLEQESEVRVAILAHVKLLKERGPQLNRPYVDTIKSSKYANMKELRLNHRGTPWRVLFAFDPQRRAVLLVGGNKEGDKRWYLTNPRIADERFRRYLNRLEEPSA